MSQASGWHAKTPNMQFVLCVTAKAGLHLLKTLAFLGGSGRGAKASNLALLRLQLAQLELLVQTSPARPLQGRLGGPTWPI